MMSQSSSIKQNKRKIKKNHKSSAEIVSRIVASGHSSSIVDRPLLCCVSFRVHGRSTQSSARKEISSAKRRGGSQGGWKTDLGPSTKAGEEESGLKGGKGRAAEKEGGDESASPSSFCCANVTSDC